MDTTNPGIDFFADFPPVSKDEWLKKISSDLKDRLIEELDWRVSADLKVSPFAHSDDFARPVAPFSDLPAGWEICEDVAAAHPGDANRQALAALRGGAEGLQFYLDRTPDAAFFDQLFHEIHAGFIGLHFSGPGVTQNPGAVLACLERWAADNNVSTRNLRGSLCYDPAHSAGIVDWRYLADLIAYSKEQFPGFSLITVSMVNPTPDPSPEGRGVVERTVSGSPLPSGEGPGVGLTQLLQKGNTYLENLSARGVPVSDIAGAMQFSIPVGRRYFLEIAKIRAFKLLWLNVLQTWGTLPEYPFTAVHFDPDVYTDDLYTNMIRATTMAMSGVLGGAERLTVLPCDAGRETQATYPQEFSRRIARNVQHLLKMESGFDRIADPAAGSYYIEKLTLQLAEHAWKEFAA